MTLKKLEKTGKSLKFHSSKSLGTLPVVGGRQDSCFWLAPTRCMPWVKDQGSASTGTYTASGRDTHCRSPDLLLALLGGGNSGRLLGASDLGATGNHL